MCHIMSSTSLCTYVYIYNASYCRSETVASFDPLCPLKMMWHWAIGPKQNPKAEWLKSPQLECTRIPAFLDSMPKELKSSPAVARVLVDV